MRLHFSEAMFADSLGLVRNSSYPVIDPGNQLDKVNKTTATVDSEGQSKNCNTIIDYHCMPPYVLGLQVLKENMHTSATPPW